MTASDRSRIREFNRAFGEIEWSLPGVLDYVFFHEDIRRPLDRENKYVFPPRKPLLDNPFPRKVMAIYV